MKCHLVLSHVQVGAVKLPKITSQQSAVKISEGIFRAA